MFMSFSQTESLRHLSVRKHFPPILHVHVNSLSTGPTINESITITITLLFIAILLSQFF